MNDAIQWHRACEIIKLPLEERGYDWPNSLDIEQIAILHYPGQGSEQDRLVLLSALRAALAHGHMPMFHGFHAVRAGSRDARGVLRTSPSPHVFPTISKAAYERWKDRPPFPEDSPLRGWIDEQDSDPRHKSNGQIVPYKRPERTRDDWSEVVIAAIEEHESDQKKTGTETQIWSRIVTSPPKGYHYEWDSRQQECRMLGNPPLSRKSFSERFSRLYPDAKPR